MYTKKPFIIPALVLFMLAGTATGATAGDGSDGTAPESAHVDKVVRDDGTPGGSGDSNVCPSSPTGKCTNDLGMWWRGSCWARQITTTESAIYDGAASRLSDDPGGPAYYGPGGAGWNAVGGEGKSSGIVYFCFDPDCSAAADVCRVVDRFWGPGATPSPGEVAERAVAAMDLHAPQIGMTGGSPPDQMQYVNLPAWMWAADPGESTTGPITRSESDGGISVTATGVLDKTVWAMGDGATVTCSGPNAAGTPFEARYAGQPSPTCGYTYTRSSAYQPNDAFTVTVTAYWTVTWSGGGESGTIEVQVSRSVQKMVGEIQVLVVKPGGRS